MLFRQRVAGQASQGFDQQALKIDPWEAELLSNPHNILCRGALESGIWYIGALPAFALNATPYLTPSDEPASDTRTGQEFLYYRRPIDLARLVRWEAGERFQVTDLEKD